MSPAERLEYITKEMSLHTSDGHWIAETRIELSALYSYFSGQLEQVLFTKPDVWLEIRKGVKSDKAADKEYEALEDGKKEVIFRYRLKRIEKMLSSMSTMLRLLEGEAKNQM